MLTRRFFATVAALLSEAILAQPRKQWPDDADGDVFRRLQASGFDFTRVHTVDFNVDFEQWPPAREAVNALRAKYRTKLHLRPPEEGDMGHIAFQLKNKLTYEWVISVQREVTALVARYGGRCESWGVLDS